MFQIARSRKHIPESLRLVGTFFTHCTVIGTFEYIDASITAHFDEKDLISAVFHAGSVNSGGKTVYYDSNKKKIIGNRVY